MKSFLTNKRRPLTAPLVIETKGIGNGRCKNIVSYLGKTLTIRHQKGAVGTVHEQFVAFVKSDAMIVKQCLRIELNCLRKRLTELGEQIAAVDKAQVQFYRFARTYLEQTAHNPEDAIHDEVELYDNYGFELEVEELSEQYSDVEHALEHVQAEIALL